MLSRLKLTDLCHFFLNRLVYRIKILHVLNHVLLQNMYAAQPKKVIWISWDRSWAIHCSLV